MQWSLRDLIHADVEIMELLASLPAELAAIADPSARGAAPFLAPVDAAGREPAPAQPFEFLLELFTEQKPGGESWPASGNELPPSPLAAAPAAVLATALFPAPPAASTAGVPPPAPAGSGARLPSGAPWVPLDAAAAPQPVSSPGEPKLEPRAAGQSWAVTLGPLAGFGLADAPAEPVGAAAPGPVDAAVGSTADGDGLEALFSNQARLRAPPAAAPGTEARAPLSAAAPASRADLQPMPMPAYAPRAEAKVDGAQTTIRRLDALVSVLKPPPAGSDARTVAASDWLPPSAAYGSTPAAAAPGPTLPSASVDLRAPNWPEAFAQRVQWVVDAKVGEAHIKLNPPELGAVDVKVALVDDKTYVQLTAATVAARDELAQSLPRLRELFTVSGLELGGASVHDGRSEHGRQGSGAPVPAVSPWREPPADFVAVPASAVLERRAGRIDVFA